MFVGYSGTVAEAAWIPIVFEVKNDGPAFTGVVDLEPEGFGGGATRSTVVELPTGSLKRLVIPAFAAGRYGGAWTARLLDERGRVRAEASSSPLQPRLAVNWKTVLMGALARTPRGVPVLAQIRARQSDLQPVCASLQPAIFPDNPIALERLDAIYLNSERAVELRDNQVKALLAWLHAGGHLIVGVEQISDITASPWLRSIFPCDLSGVRDLARHSELQAWLREPMTSPEDRLFSGQGMLPQPMFGQRYGVPPPRPVPGTRPGGTNPPVGTGQRRSGVGYPTPNPQPENSAPTPANVFADLAEDAAFEAAPLTVATGLRHGDARVVAGTPDAPLVVTADCDRGRVTALLFSPEREPARSWKHLPEFWARLAGVPPALYASLNVPYRLEPGSDGIFGAMVDSRQVRKMPVGWLLVLLLVYLAVIGPFDRWWLRKIGRPMLTWITFPGYVVLFSLLIYFIGYKLRAGETEWNELHLVDVFANGERAELRGRTFASIYSPANQRYRLASPARVATLRSEFMGSAVAPAKGNVRVLQQGDTFSADVFVPVWISQLFVSDWWQAAPLPVSVAVRHSGDALEVTVDNRLERPLTNARLAVADRMLDVGDVPARQKKTVLLRSTQGAPLADFVWQRGANFPAVVQQRQSAFGGYASGWITDAPNAAMAASFLSELAGRQGGAGFVTPPGLDLAPLVERGQAVLLAWSADYTPLKAINQFTALRSHRDTLWRVSCPVAP